MKQWLISLLVSGFMLGGATLPPAQKSPTQVREGQKVQWVMGDGVRSYRLGEITAVFASEPCAPDATDCEEGDATPILTVTHQSGAVLTVIASPSQNILMLGRLQKDGPVVAFLQDYSGGMHCCQQMRVISYQGNALTAAKLGDYDGSEIGWPRDVDGDGMRDFIVNDDRFLYAFASYANSVSPPRVLNVVDGEVRDLSTDPRFASVFASAAQSARKGCMTSRFPNGPCAAYAANAARLGQLDAAWPVIMEKHDKVIRNWPDGCKQARDSEGECAEDQLIEYPDYPTALRAFLAETGYTPSP